MNKNKILKVVVFIVVLFIPLIYSFFYLKSYWDPYGNLQDLPVAIVNLDSGEDGKNQGDELVKSLLDSDSVKICEVDENEAEDGLIFGKYYAKIIIPEDFTSSLNKAQDVDREKTVITFSPNKKSNYLAYQIINNVVSKTELSLQGKVASEVVATLKEKLEEVPSKMEEINDGVSQVLDGTVTLKDGTNTLKQGTTTLANSYATFDQGIDSAYSGSNTLKDGVDKLNSGTASLNSGIISLKDAISLIQNGALELSSKTSSGMTSLASGVVQLKSGSDYFDSNLQNYVAGVNELNTNTQTLVNGVLSMVAQNPSLAQNPEFSKLYYLANAINSSKGFENVKDGGQQILSGSNTINAGITNLNNNMSGVSAIINGVDSLNSAIEKVNSGTNTLQQGSQTLVDGMSQIASGTTNLENGLSVLSKSSKEVKNGILTLNDGATSLDDGASSLNEGVQTLKDSVSEGIDSAKTELTKLNGLPEYTEDPIEIDEQSHGKVTEYGVSFTPLFISIGLWVGALMAYVVLYYDQDRRYALLGKYAENKFLQIGLYLLIAVAQGIITGLFLKILLGLTLQNTMLYYLSCILIAVTFMSVIQFLIVNFGDVGKFIALIVLVLQLAASGGTFPVETINKGFQVFTNFLPMTYSIKLIKESVIIADKGFAMSNILILLVFAIVPLVITLITTKIKSKNKNLSESEA